ncbi:MAG: energy transducer TonB [Parasphingopyxis sp.]|nr:energy transducer TonB [Sphingomonadales bacterium]
MQSILVIAVAIFGPSTALGGTPAEPAGNPGLWVTSADYPVAALRQGHEGVTAFRLYVGSDGRVTQCEVTESSGHPALDEQACIALQVRARFHPATDTEGRPAEGTYSSSVRWTIPGSAPMEYPTPVPYVLEYVLTYSAEGAIVDCEITQAASDGDPMTTETRPDVCDSSQWEGLTIRPFTNDEGEPIERKVRYRYRVDIED